MEWQLGTKRENERITIKGKRKTQLRDKNPPVKKRRKEEQQKESNK